MQIFKKRHGIPFLKICGDQAATDLEAMEKVADHLVKVIAGENLVPEQFYHEETSLCDITAQKDSDDTHLLQLSLQPLHI